MFTDAFLTKPEIAGIVEAVMVKHSGHAAVTFTTGIPTRQLEAGRFRDAILPPEARSIFVRSDPFRLDDVDDLIDKGKLEGWVVVHLPRHYYDFLSMSTVLYADKDRRQGVNSSLTIYNAIKRKIKKVCTIELAYPDGRIYYGAKCSEQVAAWYRAGINLSEANIDEGHFLHPVE